MILAGGFGSRLGEISKKVPKSLVQINGYCFIDWQLSLLATQSCKEVIICTGYLSDQIESHVGDGSRFGLSISYSNDGSSQLGTGGAISKAIKQINSSHIFTLYGDSFLQINISDVQRRFELQKTKNLMSIFQNENNWDKSNVASDGESIFNYKKNAATDDFLYIDYGLNIISKEYFLEYDPGNSFDLSEYFNYTSRHKQLGAYLATSRFYEIGSISGINEFECYLDSIKAVQPSDLMNLKPKGIK